MPSQHSVTLREAAPPEDLLIAKHFYQLWLDNGVSPNVIRSDWLETTIQFIEQARRQSNFQAFVAETDGRIVGSASAQRFAGLYPQPFIETYRNYGYIWNVFVEVPYRGQGIGKRLTQRTIDHLKSLGCTRAILHASPLGEPVYSSLGFERSNQLHLDL